MAQTKKTHRKTKTRRPRGARAVPAPAAETVPELRPRGAAGRDVLLLGVNVALDDMRAAREAGNYSRAAESALLAGQFFRLHQEKTVARLISGGFVPPPAHPNLLKGRAKGSCGALHRIIAEYLHAHPDSSFGMLWEHLSVLADGKVVSGRRREHPVIQEVRDGVVYWIEGRAEHETGTKTIKNLLADIRRQARRAGARPPRK